MTLFNSQWGCSAVSGNGYAGSKLNESLGIQARVCVCAGSCMLIQEKTCTDLTSVFCNSGGTQLFSSLELVSKLYCSIATHQMESYSVL